MEIAVEKKFAVDVAYNGVTIGIEVQPEQQVTALLAKAISDFRIRQQPHLLSLYRQDGTLVPENTSVEGAGLRAGELLLLRPNAVKGGGGNHLRLSSGLLGDTFAILRSCGKGAHECVAYWVGPSAQALADQVEHPAHLKSRYGYEIHPEWLTAFWNRLAVSGRSIKAQIHTHPGVAFHSATDDRWPIISQAGFLSIVIPDFATGNPSLDHAWIGRLDSAGNWRQVISPAEALSF